VPIKANKEVVHIDKTNNKVLVRGVLDTTFNERQIFIKATGNESGNLSLMIIDNQESYKSLFKVSYMDKVHGKQNNMAMFGIFSKVALQEKEIIESLGFDICETQLIESSSFDSRVYESNAKMQT
jgi:hypothetical protein